MTHTCSIHTKVVIGSAFFSLTALLVPLNSRPVPGTRRLPVPPGVDAEVGVNRRSTGGDLQKSTHTAKHA